MSNNCSARASLIIWANRRGGGWAWRRAPGPIPKAAWHDCLASHVIPTDSAARESRRTPPHSRCETHREPEGGRAARAREQQRSAGVLWGKWRRSGKAHYLNEQLHWGKQTESLLKLGTLRQPAVGVHGRAMTNAAPPEALQEIRAPEMPPTGPQQGTMTAERPVAPAGLARAAPRESPKRGRRNPWGGASTAPDRARHERPPSVSPVGGDLWRHCRCHLRTPGTPQRGRDEGQDGTRGAPRRVHEGPRRNPPQMGPL